MQKVRPAISAEAVTPSDSTVHNPPFRSLYVGTLGTVFVDVAGGGTNIEFSAIQGYLLAEVTKVYSTGTTAAKIVGLR